MISIDIFVSLWWSAFVSLRLCGYLVRDVTIISSIFHSRIKQKVSVKYYIYSRIGPNYCGLIRLGLAQSNLLGQDIFLIIDSVSTTSYFDLCINF